MSRYVSRAVRLAIAAGLTGFVLWKSDPSAVWRAAANTDLWFILLACSLVLVDRTLMAYRWVVLLCTLDPQIKPKLGAVMRIFFVSTFVGTFLPASIGGDVVRAYSLARHDVPAADAVASVLMDRMLGVLSILILAVAGLFVARELASDPVVLASIVVTVAACAAAAVIVFSSGAGNIFAMRLEKLRWPAAQRIGRRLVDSLQRYGGFRKELVNVLVGSLAVQVLRIVQAYCLGLALGIQAPLTVYAAFVPLILLVMLLPVTVNGIGTSQAAFVWFFARAGVPGADAFALSVLFVALGIVGNLPGGVLYAMDGVMPSTASSAAANRLGPPSG